MNVREKEKAIVFVSEFLPGGGASSQTEYLSWLLNLEKISVGQFRRALALHWNAYCGDLQDSEKESCWETFQELYSEAVESNDPSRGLANLLGPYISVYCDNETLKNFTAAQNKYAAQEIVWDKIPDILGYSKLQSKTVKDGFIIDAKLGPILESIMSKVMGGLTIPKERKIYLWQKVHLINSGLRVTIRDIFNGKLSMPGVEQSELIQWINDKKYSTDMTSEIYIWFEEQVSIMMTNNLNRVYLDSERYQMTYQHQPPITPELIESHPDLNIINADVPKESALLQELQIIAKSVPSLIPAGLIEVIANKDVQALKLMVDELDEMVRYNRP